MAIGNLAVLPVAALRLEPTLVATLRHLGVETIGQLLALPRESLMTRFGPEPLRRIDQMFGNAPEVLVPLPHRTPIRARMEFDGTVSAIEAIWVVFKRLIAEIMPQLARIGCGARQVEVDFRQALLPPIRQTIHLSRPSRDPANLFNLLRCATESVKSKDGFTEIRLNVPVFERVTDEQILLLDGDRQEAEQDLAHLIERLMVRLGQDAIVQATAKESHLPEKACETRMPSVDVRSKSDRMMKQFRVPNSEFRIKSEIRIPKSETVPALLQLSSRGAQRRGISGSGPAHDPEIPRCSAPRDESPLQHDAADLSELGLRNSSGVRNSGFGIPPPIGNRQLAIGNPPSIQIPQSKLPNPFRPLHLLPEPTEIRATAGPSHDRDAPPMTFTIAGVVHQVRHATGPERIDGPWWEGRDKTRDYFDVESDRGRRFWMFRVLQTGKWFLHGEYE